MNCWAIFYPRRCAEQAEELVSCFGKVAGPMGLRLDRPIRVELKDDRTETYVKSIHSQLTSEVGHDTTASEHLRTVIFCDQLLLLSHRSCIGDEEKYSKNVLNIFPTSLTAQTFELTSNI